MCVLPLEKHCLQLAGLNVLLQTAAAAVCVGHAAASAVAAASG